VIPLRPGSQRLVEVVLGLVGRGYSKALSDNFIRHPGLDPGSRLEAEIALAIKRDPKSSPG
jgi:hypothetical protein